MKRAHACATLATLLFAAIPARADDKECMAAASKGQELRDDGKLVEARAQLQRCAETSCPAPIPGYCAEWLAELVKKMPTVVFRAVDRDGHDVADATARIDDKRTVAVDGRAADIDPGKHKIRVTRADGYWFEDTIIVAQGEKDRVVVAKLAQPPPVAVKKEPIPPPPPKDETPAKKGAVPLGSWIAWGIGGAGLITFAGFGIKARLDYDDYESTCGSRCTMSDRDSVAQSVLIADIGLVVAVVAGAIGTVIYFARPREAAVNEAAR